jgi:hypothetical protein
LSRRASRVSPSSSAKRASLPFDRSSGAIYARGVLRPTGKGEDIPSILT